MKRSFFAKPLLILVVIAVVALGLSLIDRYVLPKFREEEVTEAPVGDEVLALSDSIK